MVLRTTTITEYENVIRKKQYILNIRETLRKKKKCEILKQKQIWGLPLSFFRKESSKKLLIWTIIWKIWTHLKLEKAVPAKQQWKCYWSWIGIADNAKKLENL